MPRTSRTATAISLSMARISRNLSWELMPVRVVSPDEFADMVERGRPIHMAPPSLPSTKVKVKGMLLFGSPFHLFQEGLRAVMTGISPFGAERWDLSTDPQLRNGVENGLTLGTDTKSVDAFQDGMAAGHSAILSKVPGLSQAQSWLQSFLFDKYIPGLKARAYRSLSARYAEAYPEWTADKVAQTAASDTNERFGGINVRRMGRDAATQDIFRLASLAPDWLESEVRFMARSFGDEGSIARKDLARITFGLWGTSRVLNYLISGKSHNEAPFGVVLKQQDGSDKVYSIRTMPTDMLHAVSAPGEFLSGRVSPLAKALAQTYTGRDEYGRKMPTHNLAVNILRSVAPIPVQSAVKAATGATPELSNSDQVAKAAGLTVFPSRTSATTLATQLAGDRSPTGPVDDAQLGRHQALIGFEDQLRSGTMQPTDLYSMVDSGRLAPADAKSALKSVTQTQGMTADVARLYTRASRLPLPDFFRVWDVATREEQQAMMPLLVKKRSEYLKRAQTGFTPNERSADPTYQRVRTTWPAAPPW